MMSSRVYLALTAAGMMVALTGCPDQGVVCRDGLVACGDVCVDSSADKLNCGACGVACGGDQVCQSGACTCPPDRAECFESHGVCTDTQSDAAHCGACGNACAEGEVCESGACRITCEEAGNEVCAGACVNTQNSAQHCGGCGNVCPQAQSCIDGTCQFDLVLACYISGHVRGMQAATLVQGPLHDLGSSPQSLVRYGFDTLLAIDGLDKLLYQTSWPGLQGRPATAGLGDVPNHVFVDGEFVYVVNSGTSTLQILRPMGEETAEGITFTTVGEYPFGGNTWPQVGVKVENSIYVTLLGGYGVEESLPGQRVVEVDVSDPAKPVAGRSWDLTGLTQPFMTGGESHPRPSGIAHLDGSVYVALNNADSFYGTAGPAAVAVIPLAAGMPTAIPLPADSCRTASWIRTKGESVVVACMGHADYSMWPTVTVGQAGVALIQGGEVKDSVLLACAEGASQMECPDPLLGRFDIVGGRVFVGDQSGGRIFVLDLDETEGKLKPVRTHSTSAGPVDGCPKDMNGVGNVSDVLGIAAP